MEPEPERLRVAEGGGDAATFALPGEDHTLGNALRYLIAKDPNVSFVGYSVPHPSEPTMNLRVQTTGPPAAAVVHNGLANLHEVTQHIQSTFDEAVDAYKRRAPAKG